MKETTLNKDGSPRKTGSGRKKGSTSFTLTTIKKLLPFITEDFKIPVKRIWLEEILDSTETSVIESTPATIEKIEYKIS
mgnify:CR=1|jgi:hypothetical protein|tara:strand:+ start:139 stop:375 length:237 start_codon:yes stop_codon:yes gene_type:complete